MTRDEPAERIRTDGGTAQGADEVALDPWGSSTIADYRKLFEEFGIEEFDEVLDEVPNPHYLMRRGVIFGHRDYRRVLEAMRDGDDFAVLSGFMPTGDPHIGHKLVFDEIIWHQQQGGDAYGLIADMEAHSARGIAWDEINEHSRDYLLSLIALGFDPEEGELYRQSDNDTLQRLAFELGGKANFSEFESIYGFDGETNISHMQSVVTQMADILYPQLDDPKPTVIPVGPDQDPHVRFARDLSTRMRFFKVTEAYSSYEVTDDLRQCLKWFYHEIERAFEGGLGMESPMVKANCNNAQAEVIFRGLENYLLNPGSVSPSEVEVDIEQLVELDNHDHSANEWKQVTDALVPFDISPPETLSEAAYNALLRRFNSSGREPLRPRVRFFARQATDEAFEALIEDIEGEKRRYDQHIDAFDLDVAEAEELARKVEARHGGYGFIPPSSIYHRFMTGLTGGKMSSSIPASHISLLDDPEDGYDKVKSATTGGRDTADEQRELGGEADKCPVYELYAYLLTGDDDELAKEVYDECVGGERLCGGCKEQAATLMREFLEDHHEKRDEAKEVLDSLDIDLETERRGVAAEH
ncbi:tryptophanyl-tRNA ligase [Haloferax mucosum ATCC BAA-1512]|uniref:Tryptophan--tRNA ligase n=1 Tax=Haloferax mucosum ATCC BAA-1512 TaxID=662479 RepID=M0IIS5_9EURY|nr:tryptophan--tRNA ligase [Haloferax mucosum]ELZ95349.1 tryptophanyl-tRNA ligase [Haloferax mucosum ATCC BAA-1512]